MSTLQFGWHVWLILTIEHNEDLLPLRVAHFRRLAEQNLVFVTDKDAVEDKLADGDVC